MPAYVSVMFCTVLKWNFSPGPHSAKDDVPTSLNRIHSAPSFSFDVYVFPYNYDKMGAYDNWKYIELFIQGPNEIANNVSVHYYIV